MPDTVALTLTQTAETVGLTITTPTSEEVSMTVSDPTESVALVITDNIGPKGNSWAETFETVAKNIAAYPVISTSPVDPVPDPMLTTVKVLQAPGGTITITKHFDATTGLPTSKVLTGAGLPEGIATVCTYDFSGGRISPLKTYT